MAEFTGSAYSIIRRGFVIAVFTTVIGLILPGIVAYRQGIFDEEAMSKHMTPKLPIEEQREIEHYRTTKAFAKEKLAQIDSIFASQQVLTSAQVTALKTQRAVAQELATAHPPVTFLPFYLSSGMLTWVLTLTPLAWLALLFYPGRGPFEHLNPLRTVSTALLGYVAYQWTVWTRYFVLQNNGRKVIGFANYDVSHAAFWFQELHTVLFWLLMSMVVFQWLEAANADRRRAHQQNPTLDWLSNDLSGTFLRWQLTSLLLALSFLPFTTFYWNLIVLSHDLRFLPAAIILHVIWLVVWIIITTPLYQSLRRWRQFKITIFDEILTGNAPEVQLKVLEAAEPIGDWAKVTSASLTAFSFLAPILKAVIYK